MSRFLLLLPLMALVGGCKDDEVEKDDGTGTDIDTTEPAHDLGAWLSMRVDDSGQPVVAYYDRTMDALGYAVGTISGNSATWKTEEVDSFPDGSGLNPGDAGKYASMAIGSDGTTWIGYQDTSNGYLKYARKIKGGSWENALADLGGGSSTDAGYWTSTAIDPSNNPVIVHYDKGRGDLRVAHWNGTAFDGMVAYEGTDYTAPDTGAETVAGDAGSYANLYIDSSGKEYIAFYDAAWGDLKLAVGDASGYSVETIDETGNVGAWPSIVADGSTLYIAYQDVGNQQLKLAKGSPGSFTTELVEQTAYSGADTAIYLDGGSPAIFYFDGTNNDLRRASGGSGSWQSDLVTGDAGALGFHNETAEIGGKRYVACYDYTLRTIWFSAL